MSDSSSTSPVKQAGRLLQIEIDGEASDDLYAVEFVGTEALSEICRYTVEVVWSELTLQPSDILGHEVAVVVTVQDYVRRFEGIVVRFTPGGLFRKGFRSYRFEFAPKLFVATLGQQSRTFLSQSGPDIVKQVLSDYGINPTTTGTGGCTRDQRNWAMQYAESDYTYLSRVLEEEGIFFYFPLDHGNTGLTLVDGINGTFDFDGNELVLGAHQSLQDWRGAAGTVPQGTTYITYDFTVADVEQAQVPAGASQSYAQAAQVSLYCTDALELTRAQFFAQTRQEELETLYQVFEGSTERPNFAPGGHFTVDNDNSGWDIDGYMLTTVRHEAQCYTEVASDRGSPSYANSFACVPRDTKYRPARKTPRPVVHGPQTATVSTDPDKYGRVKVKFHWGDNLESWWIRVAMPWAHNQMGFQFFPRTNSEVVIEFLDGDPERPIITGAVYNGKNTVIYTLPDNKTQSGIRGTDPEQTGASQKLNELQFEDKPGSERIFFFAEKDMDRIVVNNDTLTVNQGNRTVDIKQGNLATTIDTGNETREIKQGNLTTTIDMGDETRELKQGNLTTTLDMGDETRQLKMGNQTIKLDMGNQETTLSVGNLTTTLSMGNQSTKLDLGASSTEAMQQIELKVGANSVVIDQMGVTIKGMMITIEGQVMTSIKGVMTQINADAMLQLQGGIMMLG